MVETVYNLLNKSELTGLSVCPGQTAAQQVSVKPSVGNSEGSVCPDWLPM